MQSDGEPVVIGCPIASSLGILGRKWALGIMRDLLIFRYARFSDFLRSEPKLTPRVLSRRLLELQEAEMIRREDGAEGVRYHPTAKGSDVMPVLRALIGFGVQHQAHEVFSDKRPRDPEEVFTAMEAVGYSTGNHR